MTNPTKPIIVQTKEITYVNSIAAVDANESKYDYSILRGSLTFVFITKGKLKTVMNNVKLTARRNDLFVCPPDIILNSSERSSNFDAKVIILSNDFLLTIMNSERIKWNTTTDRNKNHNSPVIHLSDEMMHLLAQYDRLLTTRIAMPHGRLFDSVISHLTLALLNDLICFADANQMDEPVETIPVRQCDILFKRLIGIVTQSINEQYAPKRSIQYYADQLSVSPKYLTHVCKICSGKTAKELIDSVLVNRIEFLLLHSDLSVKEIAMQLGFPDVSNFGRYVKAKTKLSPRSIRANAGK